MVVSLLLILVAIAILIAGAEVLVRGASGVALRFGLSGLVVGLTVVAFGTSSPELAVSIKSALSGKGDIAVGNIIGSNLFNIAVILGLSAAACSLQVHFQVIRLDMPVMLASTVVFILFLRTGGQLARWEAILLFLGVIVYTYWLIRQARKEANTPEAVAEFSELPGAKASNLAFLIVMILAGLGLLIGGARLLVDHASSLARMWGVSEAVIGLTIVAAGTSMPELATSVVASLRKQTDIAVGNVVGSNIFNLLCIGGLAGIVAPLTAQGIKWLDLGFMLGVSVILLPLMFSGFSLKRWEGLLLLAVYGVYLALLWPK